MMRAILLSCLSPLVAVMWTSTLRANPHHGEPELAFEVLSKEAAGPLAEQGYRLMAQAMTATRKFGEMLQENRGQRASPEEASQTEVAFRQAERLGHQLTAMGETAGVDLTRRFQEGHAVFAKIMEVLRTMPPAGPYREKCHGILQRSHASRMRELEQIQGLCQKEQWEQAEIRLYKTFDVLAGVTLYNTPQENEPIYKPYAETRAAVDQAMRRIRHEAAVKMLTQLRDSAAPQVDALLQEIDAAAKSFVSQGAATVNGQPLDGPALVTHLGEQWKAAQTAAIRHRAASWALESVRPSSAGGYYESSSGSGDPAVKDASAASLEKFASPAQAALLDVIQSDATRTTGSDAEAKYRAYLAALAPLAPHVADAQFNTLAQQALEGLAAKSSEFGQRVKAYRKATDDLLRWRRRAAEAATRSQLSAYPAASTRLVEATQNREGYIGLFTEVQPDIPRAQLLASAPAVLQGATPRLLDQPISTASITAVAAGRSGVSRYHDRTYCTVALTPFPPEHIAALERDLLATETATPLSLAAAVALETARRGDLAAAGGVIRGWRLESVLARFGSLPPTAWVLSPLGVLPTEKLEDDLRPHVVVRFDVAPRWVQHECFFAMLP